jgi:ubiquinone/menaquinone biosynthesis C-methylase UbiE
LAQAVGDTGKVYGLDLSEGMRNVAQARIEKAGLADRVDLHLGDAVQLPFESDSFDAVSMSSVLELFGTPEIPFVLRQCRRVLHVGGRICVVSLSKVRDGHALSSPAVADAQAEATRCFTIIAPRFRYQSSLVSL